MKESLLVSCADNFASTAACYKHQGKTSQTSTTRNPRCSGKDGKPCKLHKPMCESSITNELIDAYVPSNINVQI